jgi:hypothetical protein
MKSRRVLTVDAKAVKDPSTSQELDLVKRRTGLMKRINRFRKLQHTYMPHLDKFLLPPQQEIYRDKSRSAENVKLFLPSELGPEARKKACEKGLDKIEEEMRDAELGDTLEELRQGLRARTATNRFRRRNTTGQRALTRGQGVLRQITIRIHKSKLRYRYARNALMRLRGHGTWEKVWAFLKDEDVRGINERAVSDEEKAEQERLRDLGEIVEGGLAVAGTVAAGEGSHTMSWIWYNTKLDGRDADLIDGG